MTGGESSTLTESIQKLFATLVAIAHNRLELLGVEIEEEKQRLLRTMAWGAAAILLTVVAMVFVALFVTVLLWDNNRLLVLGLVSLLFVAGGAWAWWQTRRYARSAAGALSSSLDELLHDYAALTGREVAKSDE